MCQKIDLSENKDFTSNAEVKMMTTLFSQRLARMLTNKKYK
jgi:hypothetical protein